ncbi:hypothetical protein BIU82_01330 [Arthrobacter sp. SW1]|uniref:DUF4395 domain-containing protein n=1 Tax=Arthrobacter sp. SW1 TaxID=1920889 RepID=UPI000877BE94|nr:DUF4395 domain-containing protein [Arthrobacter sp. SW1]OFI39724.1 hypothetical protein BIU82_01330 [Arthrobacter sp. SW1]
MPEQTTATPQATASTGSSVRRIFEFPNPVNEYAARITAGLVVLAAVATLATGFGPGLVLIAVGFWLRVLFGPRISPLALLSVKVLAPRIGRAKLVPGPPKRFAQGIGAGLTTVAAVLFYLGFVPAAWILLGVLIVAASLEAFLGFCLGCTIFAFLQRRGLIPDDVCEACNNIALRQV